MHKIAKKSRWTRPVKYDKMQPKINLMLAIGIFAVSISVAMLISLERVTLTLVDNRLPSVNVDTIVNGYGYASVGNTGSMLPCINKDTVLVERELDVDDRVYRGRIYVYRLNNTKRIVHRLVGNANSTHYIFKGDGNVNSDPLVARSQIESEVVGLYFEYNN